MSQSDSIRQESHGPTGKYACRVTPEGRSAIAVIVAAAPNIVEIVDEYFVSARHAPLNEFAIDRIVFGEWKVGAEKGEELVVCRRSESEIEIHCHGGRLAWRKVMSCLVQSGIPEIGWRELNSNQGQESLHSQAMEALGRAKTKRSAKYLLAQVHGSLSTEIKRLRALVSSDQVGQAIDAIDTLLAHSEFGIHLVQPWKIVVAGPPNVGKSSLINSIAGYERTIVFDQPGTTRDVIQVAAAMDGFPVVISDTAGMRQGAGELELQGIQMARTAASEADLVVQVTSAIDEENDLDAETTAFLDSLPASRRIRVLNKVDLVEQTRETNLAEISTSATQKTGIDELLQTIAMKLWPVIPPDHAPLPFRPSQVDWLNQVRTMLKESQIDSACHLLDRWI